MLSLISAAAVLLISCSPASAKIVDTLYGQVDGNTVPLNDGTIINSWYGIPFARPPVGQLRFAPPQPPVAWNELRPAKTLPDACIQDVAGLVWLTHLGWRNYSEDCLNLNIYAPDDLTDAPLPVMVWFHGGGYISGANIQYPGHFLAAKGVVVVVPNYRLNAFGFLASPDGSIRGNMGLLDQFAALRWVRDNIRNFGGNPGKVTIFGQSAGAASSSLHMISPYTDGLFHQAILESGTESNLWSLNYPGQQPEQYLYQLAANTNCQAATDPEIIQCLRGRSALVIRERQGIECTPGHFCQGFAPIVDGPGGFIPKMPQELRAELPASRVLPVLGGICRDDGSLYTLFLIPESNDGGFNSSMFDYYLRTRLMDIFAASFNPDDYEPAFNALRWFYVNWPYLEDEDANREAFNKLITDGAFGFPWDNQLKLISARRPEVYAYVQSFISNNASTFVPPWMGVPHTGEVPYVWGYGKLLSNPAVREDSGIVVDVIGWTELDELYADYEITLWTNFAKFGNPTPQPVKTPFNDTYLTWDRFSIDDNLKVFDLDWEPKTQENFRQQRNAFYYDYLPTILRDPAKSSRNKQQASGKFRFHSDTVRKAMNKFVLDAWIARGFELPDLDDN